MAERFGRSELVSRCNGEPWLPYSLGNYASPFANLIKSSKWLRTLAQSRAPLEDRVTELFAAVLSRPRTISLARPLSNATALASEPEPVNGMLRRSIIRCTVPSSPAPRTVPSARMCRP